MSISLKTIIIVFLINFFGPNIYCQNANKKQTKANVQREEVQRYFGYETLFPAYVTLPIDASLNTNERGYFVDLGYVFLILLPLFLLHRVGKKSKLISSILMLFLFVLSGLYISTSFILGDAYQKISHGSISSYLNTNTSILEDIFGQCYISLNYVGQLVLSFTNTFSSNSDYLTYPILLFLFFGLFIIIEKIGSSKRNSRIGIISLIFAFFWLILSSGIPWYGFLLIPLLLSIIFLSIQNINTKVVAYFSYGLITSWVLISIVTRVSFITLSSNFNKDIAGIHIINSIFFNRSLGVLNESLLLNRVHPNLESIQKSINRDRNSLVLQIGTTLGYFIDNNAERCMLDFQLGFTDRVIEKYSSKSEITAALKASGFKYILVDLNTHTLDRTPERTLTNKFKKLLNFVSNNNNIRLLGTDRVVENPNQNASNKMIHGLSGKIVYGGSYAAFEIN